MDDRMKNDLISEENKEWIQMMSNNIEAIRCLARADAIRKVINMLKYEADFWERKGARIMDDTTDNQKANEKHL